MPAAMCILHLDTADATRKDTPHTMAKEPIQKYFDALIESYDILVDAIDKANDRGMKVSKQFATDVVKGQREALEIGRKFADAPADGGAVYTALLEMTTAAQGRALAFAQTAYAEALGAGTDARDTVKKLVEANKETAKYATEAARTFMSTSNPFADVMKNSFEQFAKSVTPETTKKTAKAG